MPHALCQVADFLRSKGITILAGECTRSAYRYATWTATICFEQFADLPNMKLRRSPSESHKHVVAKLARLPGQVGKNCRDVLFVDPAQADLRDPVISRSIEALHYFNRVSNIRARKRNRCPLDDHLKLKYTGGHMVCADDRLARVLEALGADGDRDVTCGIADLDTNDFNIRIALIPPSDLHRFFMVRYTYRRTQQPASSRGLLAHLTTRLPAEYNLWRVFTETRELLQSSERGTSFMYVEDRSAPGNSWEVVRNRASDVFAARLPAELQHLKGSATVHAIVPSNVRDAIAREALVGGYHEYEVFVSYSHSDSDAANHVAKTLADNGIAVYLSEKRLEPGERFDDMLRRALLKSREVCVICSKHSIASEWVIREWGAAWVLEKTIVPILKGVDVADLPPLLKSHHAVQIHELHKYVHAVIVRRAQE
jgi:hypothetical protein